MRRVDIEDRDQGRPGRIGHSGNASTPNAVIRLVRHHHERGITDLGWLDSRHSFSFGGYHDSAYMGYRSLRVINDDRVGPGQGFGTHPHSDMEILSFIVEGELEHRDSMGNGSIIRAGEAQRMTAGTGVLHSEINPSATDPVRFLQIWIEPDRTGLAPGYEQLPLRPSSEQVSSAVLAASRDGRQGSLIVHQDVDVWWLSVLPGRPLRHELRGGRHAWLQVISGRIEMNGASLVSGDGAALEGPGAVELSARDDRAEGLLFDLA
jgi:redox-sensitive bicupin YhaK (pirin superfamily)